MCKDVRVIQLEQENQRKVDLFLKDARSIHKFIKKESNAIVYLFEKKRENVVFKIALAFQGRRKKPNFHYRFKTSEERNDYVNKFFQTIEENNKSKLKRKNQMQDLKNNMSNKIQVGDLVQGSWGYGQTNREIYQVVKKPSKMTVIIREVKQEIVPDSLGHDSCYVRAIKNNFVGEEIKRLITPFGVKIHNHCNLTICDENSTFYKSWGY